MEAVFYNPSGLKQKREQDKKHAELYGEIEYDEYDQYDEYNDKY